MYDFVDRKACYEKIRDSVVAAVANGKKKQKPAHESTEAPQLKSDHVHETDDDSTKATPAVEDGSALVDSFKEALLSKYGSAEEAFNSLNKNGILSKKEWKKALTQLKPEFTVIESKSVRKMLPKKVNVKAFTLFLDGAEAAESPLASVKVAKPRAGLAALPHEVPEIPSSFLQRPDAQRQLLLALVDKESGLSSTAVTAPKSKIASQGST